MPVIHEEDASWADRGHDQSLVARNALAEGEQSERGFVDPALLESSAQTLPCLLHPGLESCNCNHLIDGFQFPATTADLSGALVEPDYSKFENWIPLFTRPEHPCVYCRSRRLDCYMQRGASSCNACSSLFRECSLSQSKTLEAVNYDQTGQPTFFDTLHMVDEELPKEQGTFTGIKVLKSNTRASGTSTPVLTSSQDDVPGSSKRNGMRFPRHAIKILRDWLDTHADHPYPSEAEKMELGRQTELKPSQLSNWLANARRRKKASDRTLPKVNASPSLRPTTPAIEIPTGPNKAWDELNPLERWKESPPEHEPALMRDIANAVANVDLPGDELSTSPSSAGRRGKASSNGSGLSQIRAPSITSQETATNQTSSLSASSGAFSHSQSSSHSHGSFGSFSSGLAGKRDPRRRRRAYASATGSKPSNDKKRIFQCTFCTDTFKSKYDWCRHEKSLHLSLEKWMCCPSGPIAVDPSTGNKKCSYCELNNPSSDHISTHNHRQCEDKGVESRTFYRKDHLRQHLRLMHGCELTPAMDTWKSFVVTINSRCGFCAQRFQMWQERVDHLTAHFKAGARMLDWKGCRGLDPAVAAQVTNAMPPYLIGIESVSPMPFSATNKGTWRQVHDGADVNDTGFSNVLDACANSVSPEADVGSRSTCWEILTIRLGKYAKSMAASGVVMTDDMLQTQARRILYDSDDPWNQTAADNPEWLDLFKKAHGLDLIPNEIGGEGPSIPEDLEAYGDLGLRIPFAVQLQAMNQSHAKVKQTKNSSNVEGVYQEALAERREVLSEVYRVLSQEGVFYSGERKCVHEICEKNAVDVCAVDGLDSSTPRLQRWCTHDLVSQQSRDLAQKITQGLGETEINLELHETALPPAPTCRNLVDHAHEFGKSQRRGPTLARPTGQLMDGSWTQSLSHRSQSLQALSRMEAPMPDDCGCPSRSHNRVPGQHCSQATQSKLLKPQLHYLPRHRLEIPADRVSRFATATGAWEDSGSMPMPFSTATHTPNRPAISAAVDAGVTTGAMMEFLGGDLGASLPFSADAVTAPIDSTYQGQRMDLDLTSGFDEALLDPSFEQQQNAKFLEEVTQAGLPAPDEAMVRELDQLIDATSTPSYTASHHDFQTSVNAVLSAPAVPDSPNAASAMMDFDWTYSRGSHGPQAGMFATTAGPISSSYLSHVQTPSSGLLVPDPSTTDPSAMNSDDFLFDDLIFDSSFDMPLLGDESLA